MFSNSFEPEIVKSSENNTVTGVHLKYSEGTVVYGGWAQRGL